MSRGSFAGGRFLTSQRVCSPEQAGGPWLWGCQELVALDGEGQPTWLLGTEHQGLYVPTSALFLVFLQTF